MAIHIIVSGIMHLFQWHFLDGFLQFAPQLLNFAVLLSYPINFFIYCRMSRAFRDAFTKLLCPSYIGSREQRLQSIATPLIGKATVTTAATLGTTPTLVNHEQLELSKTNLDNTIGSNSSVIINSTANELTTSLNLRTSHENNRGGGGGGGGLRVSFDDEKNHHYSNNTKYTNL